MWRFLAVVSLWAVAVAGCSDQSGSSNWGFGGADAAPTPTDTAADTGSTDTRSESDAGLSSDGVADDTSTETDTAPEVDVCSGPRCRPGAGTLFAEVYHEGETELVEVDVPSESVDFEDPPEGELETVMELPDDIKGLLQRDQFDRDDQIFFFRGSKEAKRFTTVDVRRGEVASERTVEEWGHYAEMDAARHLLFVGREGDTLYRMPPGGAVRAFAELPGFDTSAILIGGSAIDRDRGRYYLSGRSEGSEQHRIFAYDTESGALAESFELSDDGMALERWTDGRLVFYRTATPPKSETRWQMIPRVLDTSSGDLRTLGRFDLSFTDTISGHEISAIDRRTGVYYVSMGTDYCWDAIYAFDLETGDLVGSMCTPEPDGIGAIHVVDLFVLHD